MENQEEQLAELKKISHLIRWIAVMVMGSSLGIALFWIGNRVEIGSDSSSAKYYYIAGLVVFVFGMAIGLTESSKADKIDR